MAIRKYISLERLREYHSQFKQEIINALSGKAPTSHDHDDKYYTESEIDTKIGDVKTYADNAASKVKNDLLNGAGTAYDTLQELGALIDDNHDAISALETIASGKADAEHAHEISDVSGLQSELDGKAPTTHGHSISDITNLETTLSNASSAILANTSSISSHTSKIGELETALADKMSNIVIGSEQPSSPGMWFRVTV